MEEDGARAVPRHTSCDKQRAEGGGGKRASCGPSKGGPSCLGWFTYGEGQAHEEGREVMGHYGGREEPRLIPGGRQSVLVSLYVIVFKLHVIS